MTPGAGGDGVQSTLFRCRAVGLPWEEMVVVGVPTSSSCTSPTCRAARTDQAPSRKPSANEGTMPVASGRMCEGGWRCASWW
jgi:hypothetical protein